MTETTSTLDQLVSALDPLLRHINMHRFLWLFTLVCGFIAWNRGLMLLYGLVAFLLAVLLVSHLYRLINLYKLSLSCQLPSQVEASASFSIRYDLQSAFSKHFIKVKHSLQRTQPQYTRSDPDDGKALFEFFIIRFKSSYRIERPCQLSQRGVYLSQQVDLSSAYPLGIVRQQKTLSLPPQKLHVLPQVFDIGSIPLHASDQSGSGELASRSKQNRDDFSGIRRYRRGDALNTIHWSSSAKQMSRGQPWVAKDFESTDSPYVLIVLNQQDIRETQDLDAMLSIATSIARFFSKKGTTAILCGQDDHSSTATHTPWHRKLFKDDDYPNENLTILATLDAISRQPNHADSTGFMVQTYQQSIAHHLLDFPKTNVIVTFSRFGCQLASAHKTHIDICLRSSPDLHTTQGASSQTTEPAAGIPTSHHYHRVYIDPNQSLQDIAEVFNP